MEGAHCTNSNASFNNDVDTMHKILNNYEEMKEVEQFINNIDEEKKFIDDQREVLQDSIHDIHEIQQTTNVNSTDIYDDQVNKFNNLNNCLNII